LIFFVLFVEAIKFPQTTAEATNWRYGLSSEGTFSLIGNGCSMDNNGNHLLRSVDFTFKPYNTDSCFANQQHFYQEENKSEDNQENKDNSRSKESSESDREPEQNSPEINTKLEANNDELENADNNSSSNSGSSCVAGFIENSNDTKSGVQKRQEKTKADYRLADEATRMSAAAEYLLRPPDSESIAAAAATASANRSKRRTRTKFTDNQVSEKFYNLKKSFVLLTN
jgi:hypothetical protein